MNNKIPVIILGYMFAAMNSAFAGTAVVSPDKGKMIFSERCTSCHTVNKQLVGPALAKVDEKHTIDWIVNFVHSPKALIQKNDKQAVALFNEFNQVVMPDHKDLTTDDIRSIVAYIKAEAKTVSASTPPFVKPGVISPGYLPLSLTGNAGFFISYLLLVFILCSLLLFAVKIKDMQRDRGQI